MYLDLQFLFSIISIGTPKRKFRLTPFFFFFSYFTIPFYLISLLYCTSRSQKFSLSVYSVFQFIHFSLCVFNRSFIFLCFAKQQKSQVLTNAQTLLIKNLFGLSWQFILYFLSFLSRSSLRCLVSCILSHKQRGFSATQITGIPVVTWKYFYKKCFPTTGKTNRESQSHCLITMPNKCYLMKNKVLEKNVYIRYFS